LTPPASSLDSEPLCLTPDLEWTAPERADENAPATATHVLLVDDRPVNLLLLESILADMGLNLVCAASGEEALCRLRDDDFALVLLDIQMPGPDGFETARRIRGQVRSRRTPIIFVTAREGTDSQLVEAYKLGAVDYLVKPLSPEIVRAKVAVFAELFQKTELVRHQAARLRQAERERAQRALRDHEARLLAIVETAVDGILTIDTRGVVDSLNPAAERLFGYRAEEVIGQNVRMLMPSPYREAHDGHLARYLASGVKKIIGTGREVVGRRKDGSTFPCELTVSEMSVGGRTLFTGIIRDSSERKRAEDQIRELNATLERRVAERTAALEKSARQLARSERSLKLQMRLLEAILNSMAEGVVVADVHGKSTFFNPAAEQIIGAGPLTVAPDQWAQECGLFLPDGVTPFPTQDLPLVRALRGQASEPTEMWVRNPARPDGLAMSVTGRPIQNEEGQFCGGVAVFHDVTERRRAEAELVRKSKDLETLLYVTSHDLREPLRAVQNFARLVQTRYAERLDDKGKDFLFRITRGADRLDRLLEEILTLSRAQRQTSPAEHVEGSAIVADVLARLEENVRQSRARVRVAPDLPRLYVDRTWATQAVYNLVANALKFTRDGEPPDVEIAGYDCRKAAADRRGTGLVVQDRGPGVPAEFATRIFELFQRAVGREVEGTGAGLAIVRQIAQRHGGQAWCEPRPGGGSAFFITFQPSRAGHHA
jgi:two-component system sensor kinase FixL